MEGLHMLFQSTQDRFYYPLKFTLSGLLRVPSTMLRVTLIGKLVIPNGNLDGLEDIIM